MTFKSLIAELAGKQCQEVREKTADYLELVFANDQLAAAEPALAAYFGQPLKPAGKVPTDEARRHAAPYGGVRPNQTLYYKSEGSQSIAALLWPWSSGTVTTLKVFRTPAGGAAPGR
ncbi:MAG: hypothetical protein A2Z83_06835 [Omnitrophica bacterium GWA2_52_8]|nr:MAG: hypothetical protein A2Z83_06835 [Omnitrophica bacterium GWA2_52_8]